MVAKAILRETHAWTEWWTRLEQFSEIEESCIGGVGDEFVALLPYVMTDEAKATAERIRRSIEQMGTSQVQVTASIGICATDLDNKKSAQEILDCADRAMYKSKQSGRNRVTS